MNKAEKEIHIQNRNTFKKRNNELRCFKDEERNRVVLSGQNRGRTNIATG